MPRKPQGDRAMTATERVHRFRALQRLKNPVLTDRQKLAQARREIEELRQAAAKPSASPPAGAAPAPSGLLAEARQEIERLRQQLAEAGAEIERLQGALADLKHRIRYKLDERAEAAARRAARQPTDPDSEVAKLQKTIASLRGTLNTQRAAFNRRLANEGRLTFAAASLIAKALHPDADPSREDREEAFKVFSAFKSDSKAAAEKRKGR